MGEAREAIWETAGCMELASCMLCVECGAISEAREVIHETAGCMELTSCDLCDVMCAMSVGQW